MHHTNKNRRELAGSTAASITNKRTDYGRMDCTCQGWGTMAASRKNDPVCDDTMNVAVATSTDKRGFVLSKFWVGRQLLAAVPDGFGQGGLVRKAGRVATFTSSTPCPPAACDDAKGGFSVSHVGA